jgi:predicted deacylase
LPIVVYLGYSIHGNESSGTGAAIALAYYLAAAEVQS